MAEAMVPSRLNMKTTATHLATLTTPILIALTLGCSGDDGGEGTGGAGGSTPESATASIQVSGAQTASWELNDQEHDFTCVKGTQSLEVLIRRAPNNGDDRVHLQLQDGTYMGPDSYTWTAVSGDFDRQVTVGVGSMYEYESDLIGGASPSCTAVLDEPGTRIEGTVDCTGIPSSGSSADTPSDVSEPRPTVDVSMTFTCQTL
jgi:hypothetical protein